MLMFLVRKFVLLSVVVLWLAYVVVGAGVVIDVCNGDGDVVMV